MTDMPDTATINAFNKSIVDEFRASGGKVGGQFAGAAVAPGFAEYQAKTSRVIPLFELRRA